MPEGRTGRGNGIPMNIKQRIAQHFKDNGFNKRSRLSAEELYYEISNSEKPISRYV